MEGKGDGKGRINTWLIIIVIVEGDSLIGMLVQPTRLIGSKGDIAAMI